LLEILGVLVEFEGVEENVEEGDQHGEEVVVEVLEVALVGEAGENEFGEGVDLDLVLEVLVLAVLLEDAVGLLETVVEHLEQDQRLTLADVVLLDLDFVAERDQVFDELLDHLLVVGNPHQNLVFPVFDELVDGGHERLDLHQVFHVDFEFVRVLGGRVDLGFEHLLLGDRQLVLQFLPVKADVADLLADQLAVLHLREDRVDVLPVQEAFLS